MSVQTVQCKWVGSAAGYLGYIDEAVDAGISKAAGYYGTPNGSVVFSHVRGKAAEHLPGLDISRGLTKEQHTEVHMGRWDGEQKVKPGYRKVVDPATGEERSEAVHTSGYDCAFAVDKSLSEFLIANPEWEDVIKECLYEATDAAMRVAVEDYARVVRKTVKTPTETGARRTKMQGSATERVTSDGLLWFSSVQFAARPTPESRARGYGADPHIHLHAFLSSMARTGDGWQKVDGSELFKTADFRGDVASMELARLLEERGVKIAYMEPDRKGRIRWEVAGSNEQVRKFFSTNSQRKWKIRMEHEAKHGRAMTEPELQREMQKTKGAKSKAAKEADEGGQKQWERWQKAVDDEGLEMTIEAPSQTARTCNGRDLDDRLETLYARLEAPEGLTRDCDTESVFGPEVIYPAAFRAAMGLGFSADQVRLIADAYVVERLVLVRDAEDDRNKLWTTETVRQAEQENAEWFELKAAQRGEAIDFPASNEVGKPAFSQVSEKCNIGGGDSTSDVVLDEGQDDAVRAICSDSKLVMIVGRAGAGKTTTLRTAVDALRDGHAVGHVVSTAVAAKRALETGRTIGADVSGSIASIERQVANRRWVPSSRDVVILDEGSMASTLDIKRLRKAIGNGPTVVVIADPKQLQAIGPAGWLPHALSKFGAVELEKVYRQQDAADREALELLRDGHAHAALGDLDSRGRIHIVETEAEVPAKVAERVALHRDAGRTADDVGVIHQGANLDMDTINRFLQRGRLERGELDRWQFFKVEESSTGRRWTIFAGDRIILNRQVVADLSEPLRNGEQGEVLRITPDGRCRIRFDGDQRRTVTVQLKPREEIQPVGLGDAVSTSRYQGSEVKAAVACPGTPQTASLNSFYVQASRSVEHFDVVISREVWGPDPVMALGRAVMREQEKHLASEYMAEVDLDDVDLQPIEEEIGDLTREKEAEILIRDLRRELEERERERGDDFGIGL